MPIAEHGVLRRVERDLVEARAREPSPHRRRHVGRPAMPGPDHGAHPARTASGADRSCVSMSASVMLPNTPHSEHEIGGHRARVRGRSCPRRRRATSMPRAARAAGRRRELGVELDQAAAHVGPARVVRPARRARSRPSPAHMLTTGSARSAPHRARRVMHCCTTASRCGERALRRGRSALVPLVPVDRCHDGQNHRMTYRVIQWATGLVGKEAIKGVLAHPELELVGCWVHSDDKVGQDVGELVRHRPDRRARRRTASTRSARSTPTPSCTRPCSRARATSSGCSSRARTS